MRDRTVSSKQSYLRLSPLPVDPAVKKDLILFLLSGFNSKTDTRPDSWVHQLVSSYEKVFLGRAQKKAPEAKKHTIVFIAWGALASHPILKFFFAGVGGFHFIKFHAKYFKITLAGKLL